MKILAILHVVGPHVVQKSQQKDAWHYEAAGGLWEKRPGFWNRCWDCPPKAKAGVCKAPQKHVSGKPQSPYWRGLEGQVPYFPCIWYFSELQWALRVLQMSPWFSDLRHVCWRCGIAGFRMSGAKLCLARVRIQAQTSDDRTTQLRN